MNNQPIIVLTILLIASSITGCKPDAKSVSAEATGRRCEIHGTALSSQAGFYPRRSITVSPSADIARFTDHEKYPHPLPWSFRVEESEFSSDPATVWYCPDCESDFQRDFAAFCLLPESEKDANEMRILDRIIEKEKEGK